MQKTIQHGDFVSLTDYATGLKQNGVAVVPGTGDIIWVQHDAGAMMRVPRFNLTPPAPGETRAVPWRGRIAAAGYLCEPDHLHPANACLYVCTDRTYALEKLPGVMRRNVRRGLKELRIARLSSNELLTSGLQAFADTRGRVGLNDGTPEEFHQRFNWRTQCQGHAFLGAWKDDQLAAFLSLIQVDDWMEIESCYSMNSLLKHRPNDTLMYSALSHYLCEAECRVVCYGVSSIQAENNAEGLYAFKRKVGFDAPLVHRAFELHPLLRPLANRLTLRGVGMALRVWPQARLLKKAEGMLAYLYGADRTPPERQAKRAASSSDGEFAAKKISP